ncbi:hypothetical protein SLEP1_g21717 [Rubroshorea leprosula]|uniref:Uncharacterized protein n=1 Tax=Rubroshorea leprosula TaxID=152421 RepID=A0AAV5JCY8_9ROSI|nr:hypothetical protein SLEP1_g21717 [Rubroshorea leprosula]
MLRVSSCGFPDYQPTIQRNPITAPQGVQPPLPDPSSLPRFPKEKFW